MKIISLIKGITTIFLVNVLSALLHPDLIRVSGVIGAYVLFLYATSRIKNPFYGFLFSLVTIAVSALAAIGFLKFGICIFQPQISSCNSNELSALAFSFFFFPGLTLIPWAFMFLSQIIILFKR